MKINYRVQLLSHIVQKFSLNENPDKFTIFITPQGKGKRKPAKREESTTSTTTTTTSTTTTTFTTLRIGSNSFSIV